MSTAPKNTTPRKKLKLSPAIFVLTVVALVFISGIAIFAYQMPRAG